MTKVTDKNIVIDNSNVPKEQEVLTSTHDTLSYRYITIPINNLQVLLIQDTDTDKAAAAMDIHVGNFQDPEDIPGLAHFLEHLLFMGTEKFPDENEYERYLSEHNGDYNAYTSEEHTNYYFTVDSNNLYCALDRFAQFFISPLFRENGTDRERKAVHSEFKKNVKDDDWRSRQLFKHLSRSDHPFHKFGSGNIKTLSVSNIRQVLLDFHAKYYLSPYMRLVVYGSEPLDILQEWVLNLFSPISSTSQTLETPSWTQCKPLDNNHYNQIIWTKTLKPYRNLVIQWITNDYQKDFLYKPLEYYSHLLGHEGYGSLLSFLKKKGLALELSAASVDKNTGFEIFELDIELTHQGLKEYDKVIQYAFAYIEMLRVNGPQEYIFQERLQLGNISFKFREKSSSPSNTCSKLANNMHDYPPYYILAGKFIVEEYKPDLITKALDDLSITNMRVFIMNDGSETSIAYDQVEPYYGTQYAIRPMDENLLKSIRDSSIFHIDHEIREALHLPRPNPYIPQDFRIEGSKQDPLPKPNLLLSNEFMRLWYKIDDTFMLPKGIVYLYIRSPMLSASSIHYVCNQLFHGILEDSLSEFLYPAGLAGIKLDIDSGLIGFDIKISGYNEKLPAFLYDLLRIIMNFNPDENRFNLIRDSYERKLRGFSRNSSLKQAMYYMKYCISETEYHPSECIRVLQSDTFTFNSFMSIIKQTFKTVFVECLVHGNFNEKDALSIGRQVKTIIFDTCGSLPLDSSFAMHPIRKLSLTDGPGYILEHMVDNINYAIDMYFQVGLLSDRLSHVKTMLIHQLLDEMFFDQLRTKEQLGYMCNIRFSENGSGFGIRCLIQSNRTSEFLHDRLERYTEEAKEFIESMSTEEFKRHVTSLSRLLLEKKRKLSQEANAYWEAIIRGNYDFVRNEELNRLLPNVTKDDILSFFSDHIIYTKNRRSFTVHIIPNKEAADGSGSGDNSSDSDSSGSDGSDSDNSSFTELAAPKVAIKDSFNVSVPDGTKLTLDNIGKWKSTQELLPVPHPVIDLSPKYHG